MFETTFRGEHAITNPLILQLKETSMENPRAGIRLTPFDGSEAEAGLIEEWFENDRLIRQHYYTYRFITDYNKWVVSQQRSLDTVYFRIEFERNFVGLIAMKNFDFQDMSFEIIFCVEQAHRSRGIAFAAILLLIHEAAKLGFRNIIAKINRQNYLSRFLLTKLSFVKVGYGKEIEDSLRRPREVYSLNIV